MPRRHILMVFAVLLLGVVRSPSAQTLHLKTENSPPGTIFVDGRVTGRVVDKVTTLLQRAGLAYDIEVLPWQRAYHAADTQPMTCVFATTRTRERETHFRWVGPLGEIDWVLYGLEERQFKLRSLEDARPYLIGTYLGDARDAFLRARGFKVAAVAEDLNNAGKLLVGRIDLWAGSKTVSMMQRADLDPRIVPLLVFHRVELFLACNPSVPGDLIKRMGAAVSSMQRDGTLKAIDQRYARWPNP
jgi:polar amino acid transport system substrate-binding protein